MRACCRRGSAAAKLAGARLRLDPMRMEVRRQICHRRRRIARGCDLSEPPLGAGVGSKLAVWALPVESMSWRGVTAQKSRKSGVEEGREICLHVQAARSGGDGQLRVVRHQSHAFALLFHPQKSRCEVNRVQRSEHCREWV